MAASFFMQNFALGVQTGIALRGLIEDLKEKRALAEAGDALADAEGVNPAAEAAGILSAAGQVDPVAGSTEPPPGTQRFVQGVQESGETLGFDEAYGDTSKALTPGEGASMGGVEGDPDLEFGGAPSDGSAPPVPLSPALPDPAGEDAADEEPVDEGPVPSADDPQPAGDEVDVPADVDPVTREAMEDAGDPTLGGARMFQAALTLGNDPEGGRRDTALPTVEQPRYNMGGPVANRYKIGSGVEWAFELQGKARPNKPQQVLLDAVGAAVETTFGQGSRVVLFSGMENEGDQHGSNRHKTGLAGDFQIYDPNGRRVTAADPRAKEFIMNAASAGIQGIGAGPEYMNGNFHLDMFSHSSHGPGQRPVWGSVARSMAGRVVPMMQRSAKEGPQLGGATAGGGGTGRPAEGAEGDGVATTMQEGITQAADELGMDPVWLATIISYETGGTFDPMQPGPTTQWGQHRGLIQFGEPQARNHGVDFSSPEAAIRSQLGRNGAIVSYFRQQGWKPGMSFANAYATVNAGNPYRLGASDANNGGAPGTVLDKVNNQMAGHRQKAEALMGGTFKPSLGYNSTRGGSGTGAPAPYTKPPAQAQQALPTDPGPDMAMPPRPDRAAARGESEGDKKVDWSEYFDQMAPGLVASAVQEKRRPVTTTAPNVQSGIPMIGTELT